MTKLEIKIVIHTENAAFQGEDRDTEIRHVLEQAVKRITEGYDDVKLSDTNGNGVGRVTVTEGPSVGYNSK